MSTFHLTLTLTQLPGFISTSRQQSVYPDAGHIIAGDFKHADLKTVLPKFHCHVKCATRGAVIQDKVDSNIKMSYMAGQQHLGLCGSYVWLLFVESIALQSTISSPTDWWTNW